MKKEQMAKKMKSPKWETREGFYYTAPRGTAKKMRLKGKGSDWGQIAYEQQPGIYKRHKVPKTHEVLSHPHFASKEFYRKDWEKK